MNSTAVLQNKYGTLLRNTSAHKLIVAATNSPHLYEGQHSFVPGWIPLERRVCEKKQLKSCHVSHIVLSTVALLQAVIKRRYVGIAFKVTDLFHSLEH